MGVHGEQVELGLQDASEKVKVQERFSKPSNPLNPKIMNMDMKILNVGLEKVTQFKNTDLG